MVRLGPAPQQPDRPRAARSGDRRIPPTTPAPSRPLAEYLVGQEHPHRVPGRPAAAGQDPGLRPRAVHPHGRPRHRQHGHRLQGAVEDRQRLVRRQGAAAAQHVERAHRPPQGAAPSSSASTPSVVPFVDVGTSGGMHYLAWPLVEGETLEKIVASARQAEPELAAQYALQAAEGLEVCHSRGCSTACSSRRT